MAANVAAEAVEAAAAEEAAAWVGPRGWKDESAPGAHSNNRRVASEVANAPYRAPCSKVGLSEAELSSRSVGRERRGEHLHADK